MAKILTQRGIETAKPRAARYGVRDGLVPGLRLLVHPSGAKSFTLFARINGSQLNVKIGSPMFSPWAKRGSGAGACSPRLPTAKIPAPPSGMRPMSRPSRWWRGGSSSVTPRCTIGVGG